MAAQKKSELESCGRRLISSFGKTKEVAFFFTAKFFFFLIFISKIKKKESCPAPAHPVSRWILKLGGLEGSG